MPEPFTPNEQTFTSLETPRAPSGPISITALARFEFEAGISPSSAGTKILMVEWEDDDLDRLEPEDTHGNGGKKGRRVVRWEGMRDVFPASEPDTQHPELGSGSGSGHSTGTESEYINRVYFLLPPDSSIPPMVKLIYLPDPTSPTFTGTPGLQLNPLPAIFPPEVTATGSAAGKKGVLHTIWAKRRLQSLEREIRAECAKNVEGVALHMALREKEWIEMHFGLPPTGKGDGPAGYSTGSTPTPVSPGTGKLGEKFRRLRVQTGERELSSVSGMEGTNEHLLSPQSSDVAVSSFTSFGMAGSGEEDKIDEVSSPAPVAVPSPVKTVLQYPPDCVAGQNASHTGFTAIKPADSEELFAKALSPRSPDLPRSPFSFVNLR